MSQKSIGEQRVRTDFNVTGSTLVDTFKRESANLINLLDGMRGLEDEEKNKAEYNRLISLSQTAYEEAAMWAVKAATL